MMIPNWLIQRAFLTPNKTALTFKGKKWTFRELKDEAVSRAGKMRSNGLEQGNRIALLGPSNDEMVFMIHGCLLAGLEIVMLNSRLSEKEIQWQLEDSEAIALIVSDEIATSLHTSNAHIISFSSLLNSIENPLEMNEQWDQDQTITIMYTSGTTGFPKGVRQTVGNHVSSALSSVLNLGLNESDVWLCSVPLFHISGFSILVRSVLYGMEIRLYEKFNAEAIAKDIQDGVVTRISVVSQTLDKIVRQLEENDSRAHHSFQTVLAGGGPVPLNYLQRAREVKLPVLQTYGMTETSSQTATLPVADCIRKIGSAGKPLFFNQITIRDTNEPNVLGEVLVRGPHVTPGYIGRFESLDPLEQGWLATGDIGYLDDEGYLYIVDRRSDLIISGGENIYPAEIENVLVSHPSISEAGVCGQEHPKWGSVPIAFVVCNKKITVEEVIDFCSNELASYKVPKEIRFVDALPRNASNKLVRRELKEWLVSK